MFERSKCIIAYWPDHAAGWEVSVDNKWASVWNLVDGINKLSIYESDPPWGVNVKLVYVQDDVFDAIALAAAVDVDLARELTAQALGVSWV